MCLMNIEISMSRTESPRLLSRLKSIDAHPKLSDAFAEQTTTGGVISMLTVIAICILVVSELRNHFFP